MQNIIKSLGEALERLIKAIESIGREINSPTGVNKVKKAKFTPILKTKPNNNQRMANHRINYYHHRGNR